VFTRIKTYCFVGNWFVIVLHVVARRRRAFSPDRSSVTPSSKKEKPVALSRDEQTRARYGFVAIQSYRIVSFCPSVAEEHEESCAPVARTPVASERRRRTVNFGFRNFTIARQQWSRSDVSCTRETFTGRRSISKRWPRIIRSSESTRPR